MLYKNDEQIKDFKPYFKELASVFPASFTSSGAKSNGKPVKIKLREDKRGGKFFVYRRGDTSMPLAEKHPEVPTTRLSTKVNVLNEDTGLSDQVIYSTVPAKKTNNGIEYKAGTILLQDFLILDPVKDIEKIIFLYFYSPNFSNGKQARRNARFKFVVPAQEVVGELARVRLETKYSKLLIETEGLDSDMFNSIFTLLGLYSSGDGEDVDRFNLYKLLLKDAEIRSNFDRHYLALSSEDSGNTLQEVGAVVKKAKDKGILLSEGGAWVVKNDVGLVERRICDVKGHGAGIQKNLIDFIKSSPSDLEFLKEKI